MTDPDLKAAAAERKAERKREVQRAKRAANKKAVEQRGLVLAKNPLNARTTRDVSPEASARRAETSRLRIQTSKIIDRIQKHAMGLNGMTPTQLAAAQTLLRKTLPDLVGVKAELDVSPVIFNFAIGPKQSGE